MKIGKKASIVIILLLCGAGTYAVYGAMTGDWLLSFGSYVNQGFVDWHPASMGGNVITGTQFDYYSGGNHYVGNVYRSNLQQTGDPVDVRNFTLSDGRIVKVRDYFYTGHIVAATTAKASYVVPAVTDTYQFGQIGYKAPTYADVHADASLPYMKVPGAPYPTYSYDSAGNGMVGTAIAPGTYWRTATQNYRVIGPIEMQVSLNPLQQAWDITSKDSNNYYVLNGTWAGVISADSMENSTYGLTSTGGATIITDLGQNPTTSTATDTQTPSGQRASATSTQVQGLDVAGRITSDSAAYIDPTGGHYGSNGLGIIPSTGPLETEGAYAVGETAGNELSIYSANDSLLAGNFTWDANIGNMELSNVKFYATCNMQPQMQVQYTRYDWLGHGLSFGWFFGYYIAGSTTTPHTIVIPSATICDNVYVDYTVKIGVQLASCWNVVPQQFAQDSDPNASNYVPDLSRTPSTWATNNTYNGGVISQTGPSNLNVPTFDLGTFTFWVVVIIIALIVLYIYLNRRGGSGSSSGGNTVNVYTYRPSSRGG